MLASLKMRRLLFVASFATILLYQNCAQNPDNMAGLDSQMDYDQKLPFAYSAKIDTLAYMSCSNMNDESYQTRAYFTFRAGAYSSVTGGLTQTNDFRSQTQFYELTKRGQVLTSSVLNSNTLLNLSVRSVTNVQSIYAPNNNAVTGQREIDSFLPPLDSPMIAGPFAALDSGQYINYFPGDGDKRLMEASLRYMSSESIADDNRNNFNSGAAMLVMGYSGNADELDPTLRTPPIDANSPSPTTANGRYAFGTGFKMNFVLPNGYAAQRPRVISPYTGVQEFDLTTGQQRDAYWDCSANYQFMVVRPDDVGQLSTCYAGVDRYYNTSQQAALTAIRRVLRVEDWFVDLTNHCVIPKRTGDYCYGTSLGQRAILYRVSNCTEDNNHVCPHFVSVCIRQ